MTTIICVMKYKKYKRSMRMKIYPHIFTEFGKYSWRKWAIIFEVLDKKQNDKVGTL